MRNEHVNNTDSRIETLANGLYQNSGGTYVLRPDQTLAPIEHKHGYMVTIKQGFIRHGFDLTKPELDYLIDTVQANPQDLFIGTWHDSDSKRNFFDISTHIECKPHALTVAREHNELAIWDCRNNCEIRL